MLQEGINGFSMALADSVPGVSGGTVAFIMGFYDRFIGSIHGLAFGKGKERKEAAVYLLKLGAGWVVGMALSATVLSVLFERYIYIVSSLFIGFIVGSVPLIVREEKDSLREPGMGLFFGSLGMAAVAGITWLNGRAGTMTVDLGQLSVGTVVRLFLYGMIAICAMFLPGISGSTLLLIFGAYMPVMTAIKGMLSMELSYLPGLCIFGCGIVAGALTTVRVIRICLDKYRSQTVWTIIGMMMGSLYAVVMGPTTLETPQAALSIGSFHIPAAAAGVLLVLGMQKMKEKNEEKEKQKARRTAGEGMQKQRN